MGIFARIVTAGQSHDERRVGEYSFVVTAAEEGVSHAGRKKLVIDFNIDAGREKGTKLLQHYPLKNAPAVVQRRLRGLLRAAGVRRVEKLVGCRVFATVKYVRQHGEAYPQLDSFRRHDGNGPSRPPGSAGWVRDQLSRLRHYHRHYSFAHPCAEEVFAALIEHKGWEVYPQPRAYGSLDAMLMASLGLTLKEYEIDREAREKRSTGASRRDAQ